MAENHIIAKILMTFGGLFLVGLLADLLGRHTPLPRVTLLLLAGFAIGPQCLDWLPEFIHSWFPLLTNIALAMIGFSLGQKVTPEQLRRMGGTVLALSLSVVLVTFLLVFSILSLFGFSLSMALLLAAIATATAPAATTDVVREDGYSGEIVDILLGIVAIDDAWGLLLFSAVLTVLSALSAQGDALVLLLHGVSDLGGALLLGVLLGVPMAQLSCRIRPGESTQAEVLGMVLLCAGLAAWFDVSYLLASMCMGAVVAHQARHCVSPFQVVEEFEWPFLILFFLLAGAAFEPAALAHVGLLGGCYILLRICGRLCGGIVGGALAHCDRKTSAWLGAALMPQAGVAIGMVLIAGQHFPALQIQLLPVILGSTVFFELFGPPATRLALTRLCRTADKRL